MGFFSIVSFEENVSFDRKALQRTAQKSESSASNISKYKRVHQNIMMRALNTQSDLYIFLIVFIFMILMSKSANVHINKNFDLWTSYQRFKYLYCFYSCGSIFFADLASIDQNTFIIKKPYVKDLKNLEIAETSRPNRSQLLQPGATSDWKVSHWNEISLKKQHSEKTQTSSKIFPSFFKKKS